ncbi:IucA/IucC family protein [Sphaerisporangium dianthi]|uniref:IucA/IucC family protein n=1 Tax=Sphaerisporangium dianthi TaxID=1436120 RepID=A0ABV9CHH2_9ACTN
MTPATAERAAAPGAAPESRETGPEGEETTARTGGGSREPYLAARVLDALIREDYGGLAARMTRTKDGVQLVLPSGRRVRLAPGQLYQDFMVAHTESLTLREVLDALTRTADPGDGEGVAAFAEECRAALRAYELHEARREGVLARLRPSFGPAAGGMSSRDAAGEAPLGRSVAYETLAAFVDHPVYPTSRARLGLADAEITSYAPEFAPSFLLRWAAVPVDRLIGPGGGTAVPAGGPARSDGGTASPDDRTARSSGGAASPQDGTARTGGRVADSGGGAGGDLPGWWPRGDAAYVRFPVHPLTFPAVRAIPGVLLLDEPYLVVRPTLSMRTVEVEPRTHLKLPLTTSTLGARNRRSIKPGTLEDGARAELLLREVLRREPDAGVLVADEQTYAHAGHDHLGWLLRRLPPGEIVPVAALTAPFPGGGRVIDHLAGRYRGGEVSALLAEYLRVLFTWNVRLFVTYGIALEAHQQNLSLVFDEDAGAGAAMRLLVKDNDGLLVSPERLVATGLEVPGFTDPRMLNGDPHALADVFVTITLHLAAAAVAFGAGHGELVAPALENALAEHGGHPMARLLRARTLDAARLVGKSMVSAGTLVARSRIVSADINKHYGASGPNYLRHHPRREVNH